MFHELRTESVLTRDKAGLWKGVETARRLRMEQDLILWTRGGGIQGRLGAAYPKVQAESMGGSEARKEGPGPRGLGVKASEWGKVLREVGPQSLSVKAFGLGNLGGRSPSGRHFELSKTGEVAANTERVGEDEKGYWLVAE